MNFLPPESRLRSHIVVIKGDREPDSFLEAAKRQIEELNIEVDIKLTSRKDGTVKPKTIRVNQTLVGFGVIYSQLRRR